MHIPPAIITLLEQIITTEGGFTDDSHDSAHQKRIANGDKWDSYCTNLGITQFTLSVYLQKQASRDDIFNLDKTLAQKIYYTEYLLKPKLDKFGENIMPQLLDMSINMGPTKPVMFLQQVYNEWAETLQASPITKDGIVGNKTIAAINEMRKDVTDDNINLSLYNMRIKFYHHIATINPKNKKFLNGWIRRANKYKPK